jgi:hypothetical protein
MRRKSASPQNQKSPATGAANPRTTARQQLTPDTKAKVQKLGRFTLVSLPVPESPSSSGQGLVQDAPDPVQASMCEP